MEHTCVTYVPLATYPDAVEDGAIKAARGGADPWQHTTARAAFILANDYSLLRLVW